EHDRVVIVVVLDVGQPDLIDMDLSPLLASEARHVILVPVGTHDDVEAWIPRAAALPQIGDNVFYRLLDGSRSAQEVHPAVDQHPPRSIASANRNSKRVPKP